MSTPGVGDCFLLFAVGLEAMLVQFYLTHRAASLFANRVVKVAYMIFVGLIILTGCASALWFSASALMSPVATRMTTTSV